MDKSYVSEFSGFMNHYLEDHPDVVEEQRRGWDSFWDVKIDKTALHITREDIVPDDNYGFNWHVWRH